MVRIMKITYMKKFLQCNENNVEGLNACGYLVKATEFAVKNKFKILEKQELRACSIDYKNEKIGYILLKDINNKDLIVCFKNKIPKLILTKDDFKQLMV